MKWKRSKKAQQEAKAKDNNSNGHHHDSNTSTNSVPSNTSDKRQNSIIQQHNLKMEPINGHDSAPTNHPIQLVIEASNGRRIPQEGHEPLYRPYVV